MFYLALLLYKDITKGRSYINTVRKLRFVCPGQRSEFLFTNTCSSFVTLLDITKGRSHINSIS